MAWDVILLVAGLMLLIKGGDLFVSAALRIAEFMRMPRVVIGTTLVALATTTPELVVSIMAGSRGESGLALGNAMGSVICNIGLILGVTATLKHVDVHPPMLRVPLIAMFLAGALLLLMTTDLVLSRWQGMLMLMLGAGYFAYDFMHHARIKQPAVVAEAAAIEQPVAATSVPWFQTRLGTAVQFALAAGIVVLGSRLLVDSAVKIATTFGIPSMVIGLTVVAVGTSLPELITAVASSRKSVSDLAVGNVLGANIANLTLIVGTAATMHSVSMDRLTQLFNFPAMLLIMGLLLWMLLTDRRVTRREGVILLTAYCAYLAAVVILNSPAR